jgi:hypothetical protein
VLVVVIESLVEDLAFGRRAGLEQARRNELK